MPKHLTPLAFLVSLMFLAISQRAQTPELVIQTGHLNAVTSFAFSPDEKILASVGNEGEIKLWDLERDIELRTLDGDSNLVRAIVFRPDGKALASAGRDGKIKLWDIDSGKVFLTLSNKGAINCAAFSPDGRFLATGDENNVIYLWDLDLKQPVKTFNSEHFVGNLSFASNGTILYGGSRTGLTVWDTQTEKPIKTLKQFIYKSKSVTISGEGKIFASILFGDTSNIVRNPSEKKLAVDTSLKKVNYVSGSRREAKFPIELWGIEKEKRLCSLPGHESTILSSLFSPDGKTLATGSADGIIKLWDVATCGENASFKHSDSVYSVSFSPSGKTIAGGSGDNLIKLWDLGTGITLKLYSRPSKIITASLRPDGKMLAIATWDRKISFLDLESGKVVNAIPVKIPPLSIAFSPDGKTLAIKTIYDELSSLDINSNKEIAMSQLPTWFENSVNQYNIDIQQGRTKMRLTDREQKLLGEFVVFQPDDWVVRDADKFFYGSEIGQTRLLWRFTENLYDIAPVEAFYYEYYYPGLQTTLTTGEKPKALTGTKPFEEKDIRQPSVFICSQCPCSAEVRYSVREESVEQRESTICIDIVASPDFVSNDFIDFNALAKQLAQPPDEMSKKIFSEFLVGNILNNQKTLQDYVRTLSVNNLLPPDRAVTQMVRREFSGFLRRKDFYKDFSSLVANISPATRSLWLSNPKGIELVWLNRMLLEDAFRKNLKTGKIFNLESQSGQTLPAPAIESDKKGICPRNETCLQDLRLFWNDRLIQRWYGDVTKSCKVVNRYRVQCRTTVPVVKGVKNLYRAYLFNQDRVKSRDGELILNLPGK